MKLEHLQHKEIFSCDPYFSMQTNLHSTSIFKVNLYSRVIRAYEDKIKTNKVEIFLTRRYDYQRITVNFGFEGLPIANNLDFGASLQLSSGHSSCYYCSTMEGKKQHMKMHVFKIRLYVENLGHVSIHFSPKINGLYLEFNKKI